MPRKGNTLRFLYTAAVFIILETAAALLVYYKGPVQAMWISQGGQWLMANVYGTTESVKRYFSLEKENERLSEEKELLLMELMKYSIEEEDSTYARNVAEAEAAFLSEKNDTIDRFRFIPAKIRKISNNRQHNYILLGKGSQDGVRPMSGVITRQGVLGVVDVVSRRYCFARSFKNSDMKVSSRLGREGPLGILSWDGLSDTGAVLDGIPMHIEVEQGDTVFTSGYSDMFPSNIPLGVAVGKTVVNGTYYRIKVEMFQDVGIRRFATIVCSTDMDEISDLEEKL